jgi:hypothetical protein
MSNQRFLISRPTISDKLTVADTYAIVPITEYGTAKNYWDTWHLNGKAMRFQATTKDLLVKIMGSLGGVEDADFTETVEAEFSVAVGSPVKKDIGGLWAAIQVQVKPASSGQNGTLSVKAFGSSLADILATAISGGHMQADILTLPADATRTPKGNAPKNVTTAGVRVALASTQVYKELTIIAKSTNTGNIYIGDSTVSSTAGIIAILPAGAYVTMNFVDAATLYLGADVSGEGVTFGGMI